MVQDFFHQQYWWFFHVHPILAIQIWSWKKSSLFWCSFFRGLLLDDVFGGQNIDSIQSVYGLSGKPKRSKKNSPWLGPMLWTSNFIAKTLSTMIISTTQTIFSKKWEKSQFKTSIRKKNTKLQNLISINDLNVGVPLKMFLIIQREPLQQQQNGAKKNCWWKKIRLTSW